MSMDRAMSRHIVVLHSLSCLGAVLVAALAGGFVRADEKPQVTAASERAEVEPPAELTIDSPGDTIEVPPGRPEWIGSEPITRGKVHTIAVSSGPFALDKQSRAALDQALVKATNDYIAEQLGSDYAPRVIRYDARTIKKRFVKPEHTYHDVARYSVGWMHENFALLEFGPEFRNELDRRWTKVKATSRVAQTGLLSGDDRHGLAVCERASRRDRERDRDRDHELHRRDPQLWIEACERTVPDTRPCRSGMRRFHIDAYGFLQLCSGNRAQSYDLRKGSFQEGFYDYLPSFSCQWKNAVSSNLLHPSVTHV